MRASSRMMASRVLRSPYTSRTGWMESPKASTVAQGFRACEEIAVARAFQARVGGPERAALRTMRFASRCRTDVAQAFSTLRCPSPPDVTHRLAGLQVVDVRLPPGAC